VGTTIVPQLFFFAVLFTVLMAFSYEVLYSIGFVTYVVVVSAAMLAALWYETLRLWRRLVGE
jgi:hypothetical protein